MVKSSIRLQCAGIAAAMLIGVAALQGCAALGAAPSVAASSTSSREASMQAVASPAAPASAASAPAARPAAQAGKPPAFAEVTKDAQRIDGALPMWRKDEKLWIELAPSAFDQPLLMSPKLKSGIGEASVFGGLMASPVGGAGGPQVIAFKRVHNQVQMLALNLDVTAAAGTPQARAVEAGFSPSLLGSAAVASQPDPQSQAVLIEANGLFLSDLLGLGMRLQRSFRQGYSLDARNSAIMSVRATPQAMVIETRNHFYTASLATPPHGTSGSGSSSAPAPSVPSWLPDARSLFIEVQYSLASLPAQPMAARRLDPRVGLFASTRLDFSNDLARTPRQRIVNRWRLEKKNPDAEMSEPARPITFWIDRTVPVEYRGAVTEGILEWNRAFERIGLRGAIAVRQQPDDADFDTLDFGVASVRWMTNIQTSFAAIGPRHVDPRTGEILDADIAIESIAIRMMRALRMQVLAREEPAAQTADTAEFETCQHGDFAAEQLGYALDVLAARGELDADGAQADAFVHDYIKATVMHEVGHALGLRHNFRASRAYKLEQLADPEFTREHGTTGSVMEYQGVNLGRAGERNGTPFQIALGPYDYWAIEYAYKVVPAEQEAAELERIAARSNDPLLAFGTDEDAALGIDPEVMQFDLGDDPLAFAERRLAIAREMFGRQETRHLDPGHDWSVLRRSLTYAISDAGRAVNVLARQIGGVRTLRDYAGSQRDPLLPVPADTQRRALEQIARTVFAPDALAVSPKLQRRLAPDYLDRSEIAGVATDYPVTQRLLDLQRAALTRLMSDAVAARVLDNVSMVDQGADAFTLAELYERLMRDVWAELDHPDRDIDAARRELQREHLNRLANAVLRPTPQTRADARSLLRGQARELLARIERVLRRPRGLSATSVAHLRDSADTLREVLRASLQRGGV
jgi:hypothetical protein